MYLKLFFDLIFSFSNKKNKIMDTGKNKPIILVDVANAEKSEKNNIFFIVFFK